MEPYVELDGSAQLDPFQWEWGVYAGVSGSISFDLRGWDDSWADLPQWDFDVIPETTLYHQSSDVTQPVITQSPGDQTVMEGAMAQFRVDAKGTAPIYCQWQHNGANLADDARFSGCQSPSLVIRQVQMTDAGQYRVMVSTTSGSVMSSHAQLTVYPVPGMVPIPDGSLTMGNCMDPAEGDSDELPLHTVYVSAFHIDKYDVSKALWDQVYQWAANHGYGFDHPGYGKAANHPVQNISWYDAVKWCNARSEMEGRVPAYFKDTGLSVTYRTGQLSPNVNWSSGYRLPTEAEWEKAARGGASGLRFPWSDTISWSQANYDANPSRYAYDVNPTSGFNPTFNDGIVSYTSPVGSFPANGYGLYDMAGNVWQWCWDWYGAYSSGSQTDPRGPTSGQSRVLRGGAATAGDTFYCRVADRYSSMPPNGWSSNWGFRCVLPPD